MLDLSQIREAVRYEGTVSRRLMLAYVSSLASLPLLGRSAIAERNPSFQSDPFSLGVASGDPDHQSVVLWTKLAPQPFQPDGGMPRQAVEVRWEVAEDDAMQKVVRRGTTIATPQLRNWATRCTLRWTG